MSESSDEVTAGLRREVVAAVRSGRITGREVMDALGISSSELGGWCRAESARRGEAGRGVASSGFARVAIVGSAPRRSVAEVVLRGGRRVRVAAGFDEAEVVRLLRTLESC